MSIREVIEYEVVGSAYQASTYNPDEIGSLIVANVQPGTTCFVSLRIHFVEEA